MTKGKKHKSKKYEQYYGKSYIPKTAIENKRCKHCLSGLFTATIILCGNPLGKPDNPNICKVYMERRSVQNRDEIHE